MVHAMNFDEPDSKWLPLRDGILAFGWNTERLCETISARHKPAIISYEGEGMFEVSIARSDTGFSVGTFRLGDEFRGDVSVLTPDEEAAMSDALQRLGRILQLRLEREAGRGFVVYARVATPLAERFALMPGDVLAHFGVTDWKRGTATAETSEKLFSIHLGPPVSPDGALPAAESSILGEPESAVVIEPSSLTAVRRGRRPRWDWKAAKAVCFGILDHHGTPVPNDPDLPNQAALERKIQEFFAAGNGGEAPAESQTRDNVAAWIKEFSEAKK
jgi:hypothetical protein